MECLICKRIEMIKNGVNPYFVKELQTGYVVIGDYQHFFGYTLFLYKEHITELHYLPEDIKNKYLKEMSIVGEAVFNVFKPEKINYELLGNSDSHLHWHIFPRTIGDIDGKGPVWLLPVEKMFADEMRPSEKVLKKMIKNLKNELDILIAE